MAQITLHILHRLEDLVDACHSEKNIEKNEGKRIELVNVQGCAQALLSSLRIYRGSSEAVAPQSGIVTRSVLRQVRRA